MNSEYLEIAESLADDRDLSPKISNWACDVAEKLHSGFALTRQERAVLGALVDDREDGLRVLCAHLRAQNSYVPVYLW